MTTPPKELPWLTRLLALDQAERDRKYDVSTKRAELIEQIKAQLDLVKTQSNPHFKRDLPEHHRDEMYFVDKSWSNEKQTDTIFIKNTVSNKQIEFVIHRTTGVLSITPKKGEYRIFIESGDRMEELLSESPKPLTFILLDEQNVKFGIEAVVEKALTDFLVSGYVLKDADQQRRTDESSLPDKSVSIG